MIKKLLKDNRFLSVIKAVLTFISFLIYFKLIFKNESYNFMLLLLFFFLIYFYYIVGNSKLKETKRNKHIYNILSLIISFILIAGSIVYSYIFTKTGIIFRLHNIIYLIIGTVGFYLFFKEIIKILFNKLPKLCNNKKQKMPLKVFFLIFFIFMFFDIIYFLRFYPAVMTPDSYYVLHYVENGTLNDLHAFGHTWFVGLFYLLGKAIFHNSNMAVAFFIIIQMIICALIFAYLVKYLYDKGIKKIYIIILTIFIALSPLFSIYNITLWRDVLFGMAFIPLFISLYEFTSNNKFEKTYLIMYILSILFILFFRNNGIYIFLLFVPFFIALVKGNRKFISILNISIIVFYFIIKGPVFNYFNVEKTTSVEAFSIPLQQISRVITNNGKIDKETYKYLNEIIDIDKIKETYAPAIADYAKNATNNEKISADKIKFITTWLKIGISNQRIYIESYLCSTLGYWYPDVIYWATAGESKSIFDDVKVKSEPKISALKNIDVLTSRTIPIINMIWSIGTMFIILLISTALMIYKKKSKYLLCYIPLYCLWASLMLASPVFSELRYIYGLFVCMPLLIFIPFIKTD